MLKRLPCAALLLLLPSIVQAADITGVPKIREADQIQIGNSRVRLDGIDAPSVDQLCLNTTGERWTCGAAARDELIKHAETKSWTCHVGRIDRRGRSIARCEVDGEDIQKWLVRNGWALAYPRQSHDYDSDEAAAREAKAGMWQGAFIAPWDWRIRNKKTGILGADVATFTPALTCIVAHVGEGRHGPFRGYEWNKMKTPTRILVGGPEVTSAFVLMGLALARGVMMKGSAAR